MTQYDIFEARHWLVSHRKDARYAGYLMVSSREEKAELHELSTDALQELGLVLKKTEKILLSLYAPYKVVFYKLGFSKGFSCHFHVAPVSLELLTEIAAHPDFDDDPDGNDATLFLSRIYCERPLTESEAIAMNNTVALLRAAAADLAHDPCRGERRS